MGREDKRRVRSRIECTITWWREVEVALKTRMYKREGGSKEQSKPQTDPFPKPKPTLSCDLPIPVNSVNGSSHGVSLSLLLFPHLPPSLSPFSPSLPTAQGTRHRLSIRSEMCLLFCRVCFPSDPSLLQTFIISCLK